jgi:hypothetical protein
LDAHDMGILLKGGGYFNRSVARRIDGSGQVA